MTDLPKNSTNTEKAHSHSLSILLDLCNPIHPKLIQQERGQEIKAVNW